MTPDQFIAEGRRLQRKTLLLRPDGPGEVAAIWHASRGRDSAAIDDSGYALRLTVKARFIPGVKAADDLYLSVYTNEKDCESGHVARGRAWPARGGTPLFAHEATVLPPIEAVFARGSEAVEEWLRENDGTREEICAEGWPDFEVLSPYYELYRREHPLFHDAGAYAVLGGWHAAWPEGDWLDLMNAKLLLWTLEDAEPWIEVWRTSAAEFRVIQRIT